MRQVFTSLLYGILAVLLFHLDVAPVTAQISVDTKLEVGAQHVAAEKTAGYENTAESGSVQKAVGLVINSVAGLIGTLLLILIVFGAYEWMTAAGNDDQITKAKDTIKRAIIGVFILLAAFAITKLVVTTVIYSTQKSIMSREESSKELRNELNDTVPFFDPF